MILILSNEIPLQVESIRSIDDVITRGKRSIFEHPKQLLQVRRGERVHEDSKDNDEVEEILGRESRK